MTEPSHPPLAHLTGCLSALDGAATAADVATVGVQHLRELTGARWAEVVHASASGGLTTVATADAELTAHLQHLRATVDEPPLPGTSGLPPVLIVDDLAASSPWPAFAEAATAATPVRSVMFVYGTVADRPTVVTVYDDRPGYFTHDRVEQAQLMIRLLLLHLTRRHMATTVSQLQAAIASRSQIGIATGIVAGVYGLGPEAAFDLLRSLSSQRNIKIRDLALQVIAEEDLPR